MEGEGEWKEKGKGRMDGRVVEDIQVLIAERHHSYPFLVMSPSCSRHMVSQSINQSINQASKQAVRDWLATSAASPVAARTSNSCSSSRNLAWSTSSAMLAAWILARSWI